MTPAGYAWKASMIITRPREGLREGQTRGSYSPAGARGWFTAFVWLNGNCLKAERGEAACREAKAGFRNLLLRVTELICASARSIVSAVAARGPARGFP